MVPECQDVAPASPLPRDRGHRRARLGTSSDAQALCPFLDGVVLVVEAGRTRIDDALDDLRVLKAANATVLGVVLNKSGVGRSKAARAGLKALR